MIVNFDPVLTEKQTIAWDYLESPEIDEVTYGGAKYGGKSWFLCVWVWLFALRFAKTYNIPQSDHPLKIGFMGRKVAKNFRDTTLETWFKTIPANSYVAKGNPVEIIIDKRVKILTGGLDNRELVNQFNSAEFAFFALDQAEETTRDDVASLRAATFGRLVINGKPIAGKGLFTANPRICWLKDEFILFPTPQRRFVPALPTDNPYCSQKYIDNLKDAFKHRPGLLRAYLFGDWDVLEDADQIILNEWIEEAKLRTSYAPQIKRYLVCDTARFGDDECVIHLREDMEILEKVIMPYCRSTQISNCLASMSTANDDCPVVVEALGADLGAAVVDELMDIGVKSVISFNPAAASTYKNAQDKPIYGNLRAEAWSKTAKILSSGILDPESNTLVVCKNMYPQLQKELCTPHYKFKNTRIMVEKKEDIKKPERLGKSPDHGDCYVIGTWAWDMIDYVEDADDDIGYMNKRKRERSRSPMRMC